MKPMHDLPMAPGHHGAERALPPGSGLLIAVAVSMLFWAALLWTLFD